MLNLLRTFLTFLVICLIFRDAIKKRLRLIWWARKIPGPFAFPLIGCGHRFLCQREEIFDRIRKIFREFPQPVIKVWIGPKLLVVLKEPHHIDRVFQSTKMMKKDDLMDVAKPFVGEGLITGNGSKWRIHRKILAPTLSPKVVEKFCNVFNKHSHMFLESIEKTNNQIIDVEELLHPASILMVCESLMGTTIEDKFTSHEFVDVCVRTYLICIEKLMKPWLQSDILIRLFPLFKEEKEVSHTMRSFLTDCVKKKQAIRRKIPNEPALNSMDNLIEALEKGEISQVEVIDELATLFTASTDTITSITSFCLTMLALHPEHQEMVLKEAKNVIEEFGDEITMDSCSKMHFLDRCIKETIRLFPIAPFLLRSVEEDFTLDENWTLPKGATVCLSNYSSHNDPRFWKNPELFDPDHHLPEVAKNRPYGAFNPFSGGIRMCLGKYFAMASIKIIIAHLLMKYEVKWIGTKVAVKDLPIYSDITVRMKGGHKLILETRKK